MTAKSDKPRNVLNIAELDLDGAPSEPVRVPAGEDGFIVFVDPFAEDAERAERIFAAVERGMQNAQLLPALRLWLSDSDFKLFRKHFPKWNQMATIVNAVTESFESTVGTAGEDSASES